MDVGSVPICLCNSFFLFLWHTWQTFVYNFFLVFNPCVHTLQRHGVQCHVFTQSRAHTVEWTVLDGPSYPCSHLRVHISLVSALHTCEALITAAHQSARRRSSFVELPLSHCAAATPWCRTHTRPPPAGHGPKMGAFRLRYA